MDRDMQSLIDLAREGTARSRAVLADNILDFFIAPEGRLNDQERAIMDDILTNLVHQMELSLRRALSEKLADTRSAPPSLITFLAQDDVSVARPILLKSRLLRDEQLIEVIKHRTKDHQLCIAMRRNISELVSSSLISHGDEDVIESLLQNDSAAISQDAMAYLVAESRQFSQFQEPLLARGDLPASLAHRMFWWVSAALRNKILTDFELSEHDIDIALEASTRQILDDADHTDIAIGTTARQLVEKLHGDDALTPETIINMLRKGHIPAYIAAMGLLADLSEQTIRRIIFDASVEPLAILCKAVKFSEAHFSTMALLLLHQNSDQRQSTTKLYEVLEIFRNISSDKALIVLRYWHSESFLGNAVKELAG